jgi:hypothetical protein
MMMNVVGNLMLYSKAYTMLSTVDRSPEQTTVGIIVVSEDK